MLNPIEEEKFKRLRENCRELGVIAPAEVFIGLKVHDKLGALTFDDIQRGHSWTRNYYNFIFGVSADMVGGGSNNFGVGYLSSKGTAGTIYYSASYAIQRTSYSVANGGFQGAATNATYGILVGTGDTAFDKNQYVLVTPIAHGVTAGTLSYAVSTVPSSSYNAETDTWTGTLARVFNNNSGGEIVVKETGLVWYGYFVGSSTNQFLMERSVLSPTVAVANGAQLTVTYTITMDFSAIDA